MELSEKCCELYRGYLKLSLSPAAKGLESIPAPHWNPGVLSIPVYLIRTLWNVKIYHSQGWEASEKQSSRYLMLIPTTQDTQQPPLTSDSTL